MIDQTASIEELKTEITRLRRFLKLIGEYDSKCCGDWQLAREALAGEPFCECEVVCKDCRE